jgi:hypothetical protein
VSNLQIVDRVEAEALRFMKLAAFALAGSGCCVPMKRSILVFTEMSIIKFTPVEWIEGLMLGLARQFGYRSGASQTRSDPTMFRLAHDRQLAGDSRWRT